MAVYEVTAKNGAKSLVAADNEDEALELADVDEGDVTPFNGDLYGTGQVLYTAPAPKSGSTAAKK